MRITLSDQAHQRSLLRFLSLDPQLTATTLDERTLELSFTGSLNTDAQQMMTERRLRAWLAAHPEAIAVLSE